MLAKLGIVEQELDESMLWLELLGESEIVRSERLRDLVDETDQLLRITVASIKTLVSSSVKCSDTRSVAGSFDIRFL